jgi:hypothetical protein
MPIERRSGYRLWVGGPVPRGAEGITIGSTVCVRARSADHPRLICHEVVHVVQWSDLGRLRFLGRYVSAYVSNRVRGRSHKAAYRRIPFEIEADWVARRLEVTSS